MSSVVSVILGIGKVGQSCLPFQEKTFMHTFEVFNAYIIVHFEWR